MHPGNVGIVLGHEVWGVTGALRAAADRLRDLGFRVAVPDLYRARLATSYPPAAALRDGLRLDDIQHATLDQLRQAGAQRTAFVGYSMGGAIALWAATALPIDLCLTLYGGGLRQTYWPAMAPGIDLAARLTTPWLGYYGAQDPLPHPRT